MANITAKAVAELRAKTGCGMMDCKKALVETDGNFDEAVKYLREKGLAKADQKASRIAAEGVVDILVNDDKTAAAMIEVNSETDFVAKNESFKEFVRDLLKTILKNKPADVDALMTCNCEGTENTVEAELKNKIFTIGENLKIRRFEIIEGSALATYIHGIGTTGVVVKFDADDAAKSAPDFAEIIKNVALQVAAMNCLYVNREAVPASVIEEEKAILHDMTYDACREALLNLLDDEGVALLEELEQSRRAATTPDCRQGCNGCGFERWCSKQ